MPAPRKRIAGKVEGVAHETCWAKTLRDKTPGISVRDHCLNVGCVAEALLKMLPDQLQALLPTGSATLAALHDVGKVSPGFQAKCPAWLTSYGLTARALGEGWQFREQDHAKVSQSSLQMLLGQSNLHPWAAILGAHHGSIKGERVSLDEPWEEERRRLSAELIKEFGLLPDQQPEEGTLWCAAGLITVADWIGSDETRFPQDVNWNMTVRRERVRTALRAIGWMRATVTKGLTFRTLFPLTQLPTLAAMDPVVSWGYCVIQ